jgi:hypothetical protein
MENQIRRWRAAQQRKLRNWRIVAGLLGLVALYGFMGRMDRDAQVEHMAVEKQRPGFVQRQACGQACKVWI